jgi:hypothetical protein
VKEQIALSGAVLKSDQSTQANEEVVEQPNIPDFEAEKNELKSQLNHWRGKALSLQREILKIGVARSPTTTPNSVSTGTESTEKSPPVLTTQMLDQDAVASSWILRWFCFW